MRLPASGPRQPVAAVRPPTAGLGRPAVTQRVLAQRPTRPVLPARGAAPAGGGGGAAAAPANPSGNAANSASVPVTYSNGASSAGAADGPYYVTYQRRMDASPDSGELYGIYKTKADADKAVAAVQKWAAQMKADNAYWGVKKSDWDVVKIDVSGNRPAAAQNGPPNPSPAAPAAARPLGWLSERYEVGKGGPGTISTGRGDRGGVSYGQYQLSSRTGTAQAFVNQAYPNEFRGLTPGTKEFNAVWARLSRADPAGFGRRQHDFIQRTHYDPAARKLRRDIGLDLSTRSAALQNVLWSTAVQHGAGGGARLIERALRGRDASAMSDEDVIRAIYAERGRRNAQGGLVYFSGSSQAMQNGVARRYRQEQQDALNALAQERQPQPPAPQANPPFVPLP